MADLKQFEFFLLRYAPYATREDFVTFGVVLLEASQDKDKFADVRFVSNWKPIRCLNPAADLEYFTALERDMRNQLRQTSERAALLRTMQDSFSSSIQTSAMKHHLGKDPQVVMELLAKQYLEIPSRGARLAPGGRLQIVSKMRRAFETAGVWTLIQKEIEVEEYTFRGDPLRIDFGYRPNGVLKMFHAVSLAGSVDPAKVLAFTYPQVAKGISEQKKIGCSLTAVVEDALDRNHVEIDFAFKTMEKSGIQVAVAAEMPQIAARAREELGG